jgi:ribonucleotide monophosphatase NagD (HAD superfamily)
LVGKPSSPFFATAAEYLGVPLERVAVVGDSVENDVVGGQKAGCLGVAVRTGTFREEHLQGLESPPDAVLDSIADLPRWLGLL